VSTRAIKTLLRKLTDLETQRDRLYKEKRTAVSDFSKTVDAKYKKLEDINARERAEVEEALAKHNPFKVGDHIRRVGMDGLPSGNVYQVTRVTSHERFFGRLITTRGQLGATVEHFSLVSAKVVKVPMASNVKKAARR
jgi:hypothetical protein